MARNAPALSDAQVDRFIEDGFIRIDRAFPREWAEEARAIMWRDLPCDPKVPATWTRPVVRLPGYGGEPFRKAANTPILHAAFDQIVGKGRWLPRDGLGTFPVRFPCADDPGDAGWHVDVSFPCEHHDPNEKTDYASWRVNVFSRGRALLMLFLFSDVGIDDAPTRIRVSSHMEMARFLAPSGEVGEARMMLENMGSHRPVALATGAAGTVYLCHPFLVHAAQRHRGSVPRFMAQPPLALAKPYQYQLDRVDGAYSPVETSIRQALLIDRQHRGS